MSKRHVVDGNAGAQRCFRMRGKKEIERSRLNTGAEMCFRKDRSMGFDGKVAIVTGAAQGIGETYARRLAREGAAVVVADLNAEKGQAVADSIAADGGRALFVAVDVADEASCKAMANQAQAMFGRIDYLINNAALFAGMRGDSLMTIEMDYFDKIMRINFTSVLLVTRAVAPFIAASGGGAIINQSSTASYSLRSNAGHYSIAKLGVNGLTIALAGELGPQNIRVNAIAPGATDTPALTNMMNDAARDALTSGLALKRLATTEDTADAALFLLSDQASFITGQILCVDGGLTRRI
jgi:3-oxoacyl-[acyl-carrier protein] reductase